MLKRPTIWLVILGMSLIQGSCIRGNWPAVVRGTVDFGVLYRTALAARAGASQDYDASKIQGVDVSVSPVQAATQNQRDLRTDTLHPP